MYTKEIRVKRNRSVGIRSISCIKRRIYPYNTENPRLTFRTTDLHVKRIVLILRQTARDGFLVDGYRTDKRHSINETNFVKKPTIIYTVYTAAGCTSKSPRVTAETIKIDFV